MKSSDEWRTHIQKGASFSSAEKKRQRKSARIYTSNGIHMLNVISKAVIVVNLISLFFPLVGSTIKGFRANKICVWFFSSTLVYGWWCTWPKWQHSNLCVFVRLLLVLISRRHHIGHSVAWWCALDRHWYSKRVIDICLLLCDLGFCWCMLDTSLLWARTF